MEMLRDQTIVQICIKDHITRVSPTEASKHDPQNLGKHLARFYCIPCLRRANTLAETTQHHQSGV